MVVSPVLLTNASGGCYTYPLHLRLFRLAHRSHGIQSLKFSGESSGVSYKHVGGGGYSTVARQSFSFHDDHPEEPLWLSLSRDFVWSTRSLFSFMAEQPSQLKFIEWPSFTTTLKTATLSLFLVAVFIVALSSVDSALCYILALILRREAP